MPKIAIDDARHIAIDQSSTTAGISERPTAAPILLLQVSTTSQSSLPTAMTIASFVTTITMEPFPTSISETATSTKDTSSTTVGHVTNTPSFAMSATSAPITRPPDPTQSSATTVTSLGIGPIIGLVISGIIVVALSAFTAVMIIKRCRRRRKRYAPVPTINPLLDIPLLKELASQRDLSEKGLNPIYIHENSSASSSSSQILTQSQDHSTLGCSSESEPTLPQKLKDFESAMQRQMEMMEMMSQRINMMALGLEVQQRAHQDMDSEPPVYESQPSR